MTTIKRSSPYKHSDGSGCWTKNCSLGHRSDIQNAVSNGDISAFFEAKSTQQVKPGLKELSDMFGSSIKKDKTKRNIEQTKKAKSISSQIPDWKKGFGARPTTNEYYLTHRAPDGIDDEGFSKGAHELAEIFPPDVMEHPNWYCGNPDAVPISELKRIQGNPEAMVTVYRSAPKHIKIINNGDWVTLSKEYATQHGMQENPADDWPVLESQIPAKFLWNDGNDLNEFGISFPE